MKHQSKKLEQRLRRHRRVRATVRGTLERPRLSVYRSNRYVYAQLIDDISGQTLLGVHSTCLAKEKRSKISLEMNKLQGEAFHVGSAIAEKAKEKNINKAVFDRGGYAYHGRVKALAEGARNAGLQF